MIEKINKWLPIVTFVLVALVLVGGNTTGLLGGTTNYDSLELSENLTVGGETKIQGFTQGGGCTTLTPTSAALTMTEAQLLTSNCFNFTASTTMPALTLTLPATSTMTTLLANTGDMREWVINNNFTAAATTTTVAAGTGIDLQEPNDDSASDVVINITGFAWLKCFRQASTDVVCLVTESSVAD